MRVHGELQPEADLSSPSPRAARGQFGLAPPPGLPGRGRARVRVTESRSLSSAACTTSCFTCGVPEMTGPKAGREMTAKGAIRAAIDVGGTFTDDGDVRLDAARLVVLDADPEVSRERGC